MEEVRRVKKLREREKEEVHSQRLKIFVCFSTVSTCGGETLSYLRKIPNERVQVGSICHRLSLFLGDLWAQIIAHCFNLFKLSFYLKI